MSLQIRHGPVSSVAGATALAGEQFATMDQVRHYIGDGTTTHIVGLKDKIDGTTAPGVNDDSGDGFSVGSHWLDTTNSKAYVCINSAVGAAVWQQFGGSGSGGITQLTSDVLAGPGSGSQVATIAALAVTTGKIALLAVTDAQVATANKDGTAGTPSMRTLGTSVGQALAGNDVSVTNARTPTGAAGGILNGTFPNPGIDLSTLTSADLDLTIASTLGQLSQDSLAGYDASVAASRKFILERLLATMGTIPGGRLTFTEDDPYGGTDVSAVTVIYYEPCESDRVTIYDGTRWRTIVFDGLACAIAGTNGRPHDVFLALGSGTTSATASSVANDEFTVSGTDAGGVALGAIPTGSVCVFTSNASSGVVNTGDIKYFRSTGSNIGSFYDTLAHALAGGATGRVDIAVSTGNASNFNFLFLSMVTWAGINSGSDVSRQDGRWAKVGAKYRLYLGVVYINGSGVSSHNSGFRHLCNHYNKQAFSIFTCPGYVDDNANTTYSSAATNWAAVNGGTGATVEWVHAFRDTAWIGAGFDVTAGSVNVNLGITIDTAAPNATRSGLVFANSSGNCYVEACPTLAPGLHAATLVVRVPSGSVTIFADRSRFGGAADSPETYIEGKVLQ